MYRIPQPDTQTVSIFCQNRANELRPVIVSFLNGATFQLSVRNRGEVQIGVRPNTMTRRFLAQLLQGNNLEIYLAWPYTRQKKFIKQLQQHAYPDDLIFKPLGAGIYDTHFVGELMPYDDFNEICYEIFVNRGYETLDKANFIRSTGINICPYCGKDEVIESDRSKRQIDHYLPKRKYPFFALSYFNLIPACDLCNEVPNKGVKDPIVERVQGCGIMQPYGLTESIVRFHIDIADVNVYEPDNFDIILGFNDLHYLDGYDKFFDLSDRYKSCKQEASEDYIRLAEFKDLSRYSGLQMDSQWLHRAYTTIMGYTPSSDKPTLKRLHRMRKDFFEQLNLLRQPQPYYVKGHGNQPVILD